MQISGLLNYLVPTITLAVSAGSFVIGYLTARRKDHITQTFLFLNEWRSKDYTASRDYVNDTVQPKLTEEIIARGLRGLSSEDALHVRNVCYLLDYAGTALVLGFIDETLLLVVIGDPVQKLWRNLGRLIEAERSIRRSAAEERGANMYRYEDDFQAGFEHIAERARILKEGHTLTYIRYRGALNTSA